MYSENLQSRIILRPYWSTSLLRGLLTSMISSTIFIRFAKEMEEHSVFFGLGLHMVQVMKLIGTKLSAMKMTKHQGLQPKNLTYQH